MKIVKIYIFDVLVSGYINKLLVESIGEREILIICY